MKCIKCSRALHFLEQSQMGELLYLFSQQISPLSFSYHYPTETRTFGEKLRKTRVNAGLTAKQLAEIIEVTESTVYNWEVRGVQPSGDNLERLKEIIRRT